MSEPAAPSEEEPSRAPADPAPWGLGGAVKLVSLSIGLQILLGLLLAGVAAVCFQLLDPGLIKGSQQLMDAIVEVTILPLVVGWSALTLGLLYTSIVLRHRRPFLESLGLRWPSMTGAAASLILGGSVAAAGVYLEICFPPDRGEMPEGPLTRLAQAGTWGHVLWSFIAVLAAPAIEELLFRGYAYRGARGKLGPARAGLAVTLVFVTLHFQETGFYLPAIASLAVVASVLVALMERTGNLSYCICCHLGYNATLALISWL